MDSATAVLHSVPWDGTLSLGEFVTSANVLIEKWNALDHDFPSWSWVPFTSPLTSSSQVEGYLSLEKHCILKPYRLNNDYEKDSRQAVGEHGSPLNRAPDELSFLEEGDLGDEVHCYDFHIVYSCSYRVPTLYFRGCRYDGQQLVMNEIEKDLPLSYAKVLKESKWTFITQQEHPYLKRPWFALHPCGTNELMRLLLQTVPSPSDSADRMEGYLISWLSVVGQVVGLRIPLQIADSPNQKLS